MADEEIDWCNACTDLVALKKYEAFPQRLLETKQAGEWVRAREFCTQLGLDPGGLGLELCATWLTDPHKQDGYAVILFYDEESLWSMAAHYNRGRLVNDAASKCQPATAAGASA